MSLANGQLNANGTVTWDVVKAEGNVIGIQELPIGSTDLWVDAPVIAQLPKTATSYTPTSTGIDVHVSQLQFEPGALTIPVPAPAPPPATTFVVAAAPTGPPAPASGWAVELADAFNPAGAALGTAASFWGPSANFNNGGNGPTPGFNSNEVEQFVASALQLTSSGLQMTSTRFGTATTGVRYDSGCISSQPKDPQGGTTGFPITGFSFLPGVGSILCFEFDLIVPTDVGLDFGMWASSPEGQSEIDFAELTNYVDNHPGQWGAETAWINHVSGASQGNTAYNLVAQGDGKRHLWTSLLDGTRQTTSLYVGGTLVASYPWLTAPPTNPLNLLVSFAWRDAYAGQDTTWTSPPRVATLFSVGVYQDAAHKGQGIVGGGVALGTTV